MSLFSDAISASLAVQSDLLGETIVYARSGGISVEMSGIVKGRTEWKGLATGGSVVIAESVDWLIPTEDLVSGGSRLEPLRHDTITLTIDGTVFVYDVQPFGPDELLWRWSDRGGHSVRRVYTKLLSES